MLSPMQKQLCFSSTSSVPYNSFLSDFSLSTNPLYIVLFEVLDIALNDFYSAPGLGEDLQTFL